MGNVKSEEQKKRDHEAELRWKARRAIAEQHKLSIQQMKRAVLDGRMTVSDTEMQVLGIDPKKIQPCNAVPAPAPTGNAVGTTKDHIDELFRTIWGGVELNKGQKILLARMQQQITGQALDEILIEFVL